MRAIGTGDARGMPLALLLDDGELDYLPGIERPEPVRVNDRVVHEDVSEHQRGVALSQTKEKC